MRILEALRSQGFASVVAGRGRALLALTRPGKRKLAYPPGNTFTSARFAGEVCSDLKVDRCLRRCKLYIVVRVTGNAVRDQGGRAV